ncbi:SEC14-like protein 2 isoform X1 [Halichondria panicea]|uniref:SEC14-like protein 2 isoform X1 n=1 Tax=Halichondria panicea TaxID=6063 RepID=UPI00312B2BB3
MSGHVGSLTPQQEEALSKFKSAVSDIPNKPEDNDYFYLRWLRARKFKVDKAEQMLRNHMTFRAEQGVDTILQDWTPPEVLQKCFPGGFFGEDRDGHPVWYDNYGNMDFRGIQRSCRKEDVFKLKVYHLETTAKVCEEYSKTKGRHIDTITSVIDLEHLSFQKHYYWPGINLFREALAMFEANYPERSKRIIVVRAPKAFPVAFNLIKPFLKSETRDKIDVLGSNWQEELQKYISPDQLPQAYGGTRCEPDPWCSDHLNPGCDVPPEYYLTNQTETEKEEMDRVVVGRGGCCELEYQVELEGSLIRWEFISTCYNISYSILYKDSEAKQSKEEVLPTQQTDSHLAPEQGTHACDSTGTYILKFDNSRSWTRSKEVFYSVKVLPPDTDPQSQATNQMEEISDTEEFFDCDSDSEEGGLKMNNVEKKSTTV